MKGTTTEININPLGLVITGVVLALLVTFGLFYMAQHSVAEPEHVLDKEKISLVFSYYAVQQMIQNRYIRETMMIARTNDSAALDHLRKGCMLSAKEELAFLSGSAAADLQDFPDLKRMKQYYDEHPEKMSNSWAIRGYK